MKSSLFVALSSAFFMTWLVLSYVTTLKPEPRLGRGSLPLSAQAESAKEKKVSNPMLAKKSENQETH
jgi:hypothetical protein